MSWYKAARRVVVRWGTPARFAVRHIVANAFPGGSVVANLLDRLLACAQQTGKDQLEAEAQAATLASHAELGRAGAVLDEMERQLSSLMEQVTAVDGLPEAAGRLIRMHLATDQAVRDGFANLAGLIGRFDLIQQQGREILRQVGYGIDLQETMLALLNRQNVVVEFVEELRVAGLQPRQLADMAATFTDCLAQTRGGRAREALPRLRQIAAERSESAAVQIALAAGASVNNDLRGAHRALTKAARLRPADANLAVLSRSVTQASSTLETPPPAARPATRGPSVGDVLDGWRLTQLLGRGGWGQVFRAERDGHVRALKVLHPELSREPGFEDTFKREILTLHSLGRHPHVVELDTFGYDRSSGCLYFLMEFIDGESLQTRLQRGGPLPVAGALRLFRQLAGPGGLAAAHARGVVHRDIKPANILLRAKGGGPVLIDFGLALTEARELSTVKRVTGYTALFAAPEQLRGKSADARSDVYGLAGTVFYAVTGQEPGDFGRSPLPEELQPLRAVLARALDQWPENRPKDAAALAELLSPGGLTLKTAAEFLLEVGPDRALTLPALTILPTAENLPHVKRFEVDVAVRSTPAGQETGTARLADKLKLGYPRFEYKPGKEVPLRQEMGVPLSRVVLDGPVPTGARFTVTTQVWYFDSDAQGRPDTAAGLKGPVQAVSILTLASHPVAVPSRGGGGAAKVQPQRAEAPRPGTGATEPQAAPPRAEAPFDAARALELQAAWAGYLGTKVEGSVDLGDPDKLRLVLVPPGKFLMGSPENEQGRCEDEQQHEVEITKPFYIGKHAVTRGQFRRFVEDSGYKTEAEQEGKGGGAYVAKSKGLYDQVANSSWRDPGFEQTDVHPVVNVSWKDARAFCAWLCEKTGKEFRLPTEAEWEYCCRAGTTTRFYGGDKDTSLERTANIADLSLKQQWDYSNLGNKDWQKLISEWIDRASWDNGYPFTAPVGKFRPNAFGLHDMHGNVWEWCQDLYGQDYYRESTQVDPQGPSAGSHRVLRGGAFDCVPRGCRAADRGRYEPARRTYRIGFRVVCVQQASGRPLCSENSVV
jgi:formylglycine-generating enzyme required for sulfatase activity